MPWPALAFPDRALKAKLSEAFDVSGIPTLVVLDEGDRVITKNGRAAIAADPEGVDFPWRPLPLELLSDATVEVWQQATITGVAAA